MFADTIAASPAIVRGQRADVMIVEAEFAFTMQATLPARRAPYAADEVVAAIATMVPALEYIGSVFVRRPGRPIVDVLVDNAGHGGLVLGVATTDWTPAALPAQAVRLTVDGRTIAAGNGSDVLGNPIACLVWLANALSARGVDLAAGEIVTTGTCTGAQMVSGGVDIVGDFGAYGTVALRFDAKGTL
jgi:2-keto-4-pentenoate hydratase